MSLPTLKYLRQHEKLRLWRLRTGLSQTQAGARFGCSHWVYGEMERGRVDIPPYAWRGEFAIRPHEFCLLSRLRCHLEQEEVARLMGVSRIWVVGMEKGRANCDRLVKFWEARGVWES